MQFRAKVNASKFTSNLRRFNGELSALLWKSALEGARKGATSARRKHVHKRRTGAATSSSNLYGTVVMYSRTSAQAAIINKAPHARFIEYPTRPHIIRARRAKALRFWIGRRLFFRKWVKHPGTPAMPFMRPALPVAYTHAVAALKKGIKRSAGRWR